MKTILSFLAAAFLSAPTVEAREAAPLKVLVITGGHNYDRTAFNAMFDSFEGMDCTIRETEEDPGALFEPIEAFGYEAVVLYNFRQNLSDRAQEHFMALLDEGIGLTVIHHAIAGFPGWREYENIIGATYVLREETRRGTHYPRPQWKHSMDMKIKVEDPAHPVTQGVENFTLRDETYKLWVYHEGNHLLLSTDHEHSNRQIAWTRRYAGARVYFIQLGHDRHAFENEPYRRLLRQGISWTVKNRE
jgi:type 1 glutamine amidotransferase